MNAATYIVIGLIAALALLAIRHIKKHKLLSSCGGSCSACGANCPHRKES